MRRYHLVGVGIDGLELEEDLPPPPGHGQVLVRVRAASLNYRDLMMVETTRPKQHRLVPLSDGAGEVMAVGPGVTRFQSGDRVVAAFRQGWIAGPIPPDLRGPADLGGQIHGMLGEWALLDQEGLAPIPPELSFEHAACFPCAGVTAWSAVMVDPPVRSSESVLIMGTGGVSLFALQLARMAGARIVATTSSARKAARLSELGAAAVINYLEREDWDEAVLEATGGLGVDRIIEVGGAGTLARSMRCAALQGHISLVGLLAASEAVDPGPIRNKALNIRGVSVGSRVDLESALRAFANNGMQPIVDRVFGFEDARAALHYLKSSAHFGKVVIAI